MSTADEELQNINRMLARIHIPTIIYTVLCLVAGLVGNVLVIFFYGFKVKVTPTYMLIVTLAIYDVTTCLTLMPFHLYQLSQQYSFTNEGFCRLAVFATYFLSFGSAASLLAIAIDRYRKICKPFGSQISVKACRYVILILTVLALTLTAPSMAVHGVEEVSIRRNNQNVTGHVCGLLSNENYQNYTIAFQIILYVLFVSSILILIILYALIRKRLFSRTNFRSQVAKYTREQSNTRATNRQIDGESPPQSISKSKRKEILNIQSGSSSADKTEYSSTVTTDDTDCDGMSISEGTDPKRSDRRDCKKQTQQSSTNTRKYTILMLSITVAFILSYLPYLALVASSIIFGTRWIIATRVGYVFYTIGVRSFLINSACNPIIYGFLNTEFRKFLSSFFCRFCRCSQKEAGSSDKSSSTTSTNV